MASIKKLLLQNMLFITFIAFASLYSFWVLNEYTKFNEESETIKEKFIASERERLKTQVQAVLEYVQYMRNQTEKRLRESIKGRVNEACAIAMNIYHENKDSKSHDEIKKMIKDALRPIRFNQNRGYYFAFNMKGIEELFADRPEMEGKNMMAVQGAKGEYVVPDMIEIIKAQKEGFYSYTWSKPGDLDAKYLKIAYVKYFKPYEWGIGTGEYLEDVEKEIQEEVLERISKLQFEKEDYFFGSIYGGQPLFTNGKITKGTKSVWELTDPKGVKIIQEQNRAAKEPEGGFVSYFWQKLNSEKLSPKLSYVVGIPEWEWLIGAGVYLDTMDEVILSKRKSLYHDFLKQAVLYFSVMIFIFFLILLWTRYQANKIQSGIRLFSNFFETASSQATTIDPDGLQFEEFKNIAASANQMIKTRTEAIQALLVSEEDLKESQRIAHLGSWRLALATNQVVWSEELYKMYGFNPKFPPPPYTEHQKLFTPESWNRLSTALNHTKDTGIPYELELETLREDGNLGWMWVHGEVVRDAGGVIVGLKGAAQDITERKQADEALKASEKKYQSLFERAQVALFRNRLSDGKVLEINERYAKMAGYSTIEECMAEFKAADAWVDPNGRKELLKILQEKGFISDYEAEIIRKDGTHIWISFSATIFPEQGFLEGSLIDITERKQAEELNRDIAERAEMQRNLIAQLSFEDAIVNKPIDEALKILTTQLAKILKVERTSVWLLSDDNKLLKRRMLFDNASGFDSQIEILNTTEFPSYFKALYKDSQIDADDAQNDPRTKELNESYFIPLQISSMLDSAIQRDGRIIGVLSAEHRGPVRKWRVDEESLSSSLTNLVSQLFANAERKQAEAEREKIQAQLLQAQKMEAVGHLAGGVAHDYNNMLSVILGYTELALEKTDPDDPLHTDLEEIFVASKRSIDITRQLLAFSRKQTIAPKTLDINEIVEGLLKMIRRLIGEDIDLAWHPNSGLWPIYMDPSQLDQILVNLCVNARDAIKDIGKITIETNIRNFDDDYCIDHLGFKPGAFVMIAVSDDGCGMDQQTQSHLFEPFFTTKKMGKGTGLGLATVYGIVKQNNGFINVYSEPGHGTTFKIYLPKHEPPEKKVDKKATAPADVIGNETILLVEDERTILRMSKMMLERLGYEVLTASKPNEAIDITYRHSGKIHLIMTDVVMPDMNGRELASKLHEINPDLKILFMSGYTANVIAHRGVLDDGINFIQKPFSKQDLAAKVREVLDVAVG